MSPRAWMAVLLCVLLCVVHLPARAAGAEGAACARAPGARDFDFWIGNWAVHTSDGTLAGHNRIEASEDGCRLDEHWRGASGGTGRSISFRDPVDGVWEQVWHGSGDTFIRIRGGLLAPGDMRLEGIVHYSGSGLTADFRGRWTLLSDGRVRQFFEQQDPVNGTWSPWFEGFYAREAAREATRATAPEDG